MIPLEEMDVLIDPIWQQLIVNPAHPDQAMLRLKYKRQVSAGLI
jgi:hypothetical protein